MNKIYKGREALIALAEGKKLRKDYWPEDHFIYIDMDIDALTYDQDGDRVAFDESANYIEYQKPKKQKEITLYRYVFKDRAGFYQQTIWTEEKDYLEGTFLSVRTETKTILVDDLEG